MINGRNDFIISPCSLKPTPARWRCISRRTVGTGPISPPTISLSSAVGCIKARRGRRWRLSNCKNNNRATRRHGGRAAGVAPL